jgi:hypothetical protein
MFLPVLYLCNQCLSPLMLWVQTLLRRSVFDTTLCDKVCQWLATGRWFSLCTVVSSTNKNKRHDITEILLKVTLNTINQPSAGDIISKKYWRYCYMLACNDFTILFSRKNGLQVPKSVFIAILLKCCFFFKKEYISRYCSLKFGAFCGFCSG